MIRESRLLSRFPFLQRTAGPRTVPAPCPPLGGNTSTGVLKLIALIFMFVDHAGKMLFPGIPELRMLGRIAFPLYV